MNIQSVQYNLDGQGNKISLQVIDGEGNIMNVPINGSTWVNKAISDFVADGGTIGPGTIPPQS